MKRVWDRVFWDFDSRDTKRRIFVVITSFGYCIFDKELIKEKGILSLDNFSSTEFSTPFPPQPGYRASSWREGGIPCSSFVNLGSHAGTIPQPCEVARKREENWVVRVKIGHCFFFLSKKNFPSSSLCVCSIFVFKFILFFSFFSIFFSPKNSTNSINERAWFVFLIRI